MIPEDPDIYRSNSAGASKTSPPGKQLVLVALVAVALVIAVVAVRDQGGNQKKVKEGNALNPNQVLVTQAAAAAVELETAKVKVEPAVRSLQANGVIHFSPYSTINVSPRFTGKVTKIFVKVGDHVSAAQPLAEMLSSDAANAVDTVRDDQEQLRLTSALLETARRQFKMGTPEVTAAEATLIAAHEGTLFNKRELDLARQQNGIGGFTDKPLTDAQSAFKQTETQLAQDLKDLELDQKQYDRTSKLFGYGIAARADVEAAEDTLGKQKDAVNNDKEQLRIAQITVEREQKAFSSRLYANQSIRQFETNFEQAVIQERAAQTAVRMAKAALLHDLRQAEHDYESAKADLHAAQTVLSTFDNPTPDGLVVVHAPSGGTVTARNVNPGQLVDQTGETPWQMFTIVSAQTVYLDSQIYEKDMMGVHIGEQVTGMSEALPKGTRASGVISYISPGLDPNTHALSVRADMNNSTGLLKDGMYLTATINLGARPTMPDHFIVPLTAVVHDGDSDYVYVDVSAGKFNRRKVVLGEQRGESEVVIDRGLNGDEIIVTHGALYLGTGGTTAD